MQTCYRGRYWEEGRKEEGGKKKEGKKRKEKNESARATNTIPLYKHIFAKAQTHAVLQISPSAR